MKYISSKSEHFAPGLTIDHNSTGSLSLMGGGEGGGEGASTNPDFEI